MKRNRQLSVVQAVKPQVLSGTTATSDAGFAKANAALGTVVVNVGAAAGSPTSFSVTAKLQECATSGGTYTDVADTETAIAAAGVTAIPFANADRKAYLKVVLTPAFSGGTTPSVPAGAEVVYEDAQYATGDTTDAVASGASVYAGQ
jgi:hypothetical protein